MSRQARIPWLLSLALAVAGGACGPSRRELRTPIADGMGDKLDASTRRALEATANEDPDTDPAIVDAEVQRLLAGGLTLDGAARIAVLQNPELRIAYERLGIPAGALAASLRDAEPHVDARVRFPLEGGAPDWEAGIGVDVTALVSALFQRAGAAAELDAARLDVLGRAITVMGAARSGLAHAVLAERRAQAAVDEAEAQRVALELATRMHDVGNLGELAFLEAQAAGHEAELALIEARGAAAAARAQETMVLGGAHWTAARLPDDPLAGVHFTAADLEPVRTVNLGLRAAHARADGLAHRAPVAGLPRLGLGVDVEQRDGRMEIGPSASLGLPVTDLGRGDALAAQSALAAALREANAADGAIQARVRGLALDLDLAVARLAEARALAETRAKAIVESRRAYNAMHISLADHLAGVRRARAAEAALAAALEEAWRVRVDIDTLRAGGTP